MVIVASILVMWLTGMQSAGDYPYLSPEELARQSELIVVGEFLGRDRVQIASGASPIDVGVIKIQTSLKGDRTLTVALLALPALRPNGLVGSADIVLKVGQQGLWYLKRKQEGLYVVDHPNRFVPMAQAEARIRALQQGR
jgi:hypothetical protein